MTLHHYTEDVHNQTYTLGSNNQPIELRGSGDNPSDTWINRVKWYRVADKPNSPGPEYQWQFSTPNYILINDMSVPQGEWIVPEPIPPNDHTLRRWTLENKYLEATKSLILLSGETVEDNEWPKLEDVEFEQKSITASINNLQATTLILATLNYTFFQILQYGGNWEEIEYHSELN